MNVVDGRVGGRSGGRQATGFDDRGAALADGRQEDVVVPGVIVDHVLDAVAVGGGVAVVGVHRRRVVAPDDQFLHRGNRAAGLGGKLGQRAVVVQAQHAVVVVRVGTANLPGGGGGDQGIGVARVADDQDLDVFLGVLGDGLALNGEDGAVGAQQVGTLHALGARAGTDQQADVGVLEGDVRIVRRDHAGQQREGAVLAVPS